MKAVEGVTEDEMAGWHHPLNGLEFEQILGVVMDDREAWRAVVHGVAKSRTRLATELTELIFFPGLLNFGLRFFP